MASIQRTKTKTGERATASGGAPAVFGAVLAARDI